MRTLGLFMTAPILAARTVPARVRLGLGLAVSFAVWSGAGAPAVPVPEGLWPLATGAVAETALGALTGFAARMVLDAALAAGQLMSLSSGIGFGALVDPASGAESNAVSQLLFVTAQASAIGLGLHREAIAWLARSAQAFPPGGPLALKELAMRAIWQGAGATALSVRIAYPVLAAVMVGHLVLGVLGRTAPQLGLGNVGFALGILAGGGAFYLVAPAAAEIAARAAIAALAG
jgi:flagellar biosynthetic protein FliR